MIAEYTGISVYNLVAKAMYPDVGFPGAAGDVSAMDELKASQRQVRQRVAQG
jgi:hypothetical protein